MPIEKVIQKIRIAKPRIFLRNNWAAETVYVQFIFLPPY